MNKIKNKAREFIKHAVDYPNVVDNRWSPETKIGLLNIYNNYKRLAKNKEEIDLSKVGLRVFSQFEEDGILLAIFAAIGEENKTFIDLGSANGINSNCANLAINFGWDGLFIDGSEESVQEGRNFYKTHPDTWIHPPTFKQGFIQCENVNSLINDAGFEGNVDLLSIDLDGNDYWIWDAIKAVSPNVVIIETHVEFGYNSIVVPYDKDYYYPGKHPDYHGASPVAMKKLGEKLGYRLVASNNYGFNTIYVKKDLAQDILPEISIEQVLRHPRNKERFKLFEPIKDWEYIHV